MIGQGTLHRGLAPTLAAQIQRRPFRAVATRYLARPFSRRRTTRVVIYYESNAISMAQVYPFIHYGPEIAAACDAEVRCYPVGPLLDAGPQQHAPGDIVLVQAWFTRDGDALSRALAKIRKQGASVSFIDAFAHNDLRLARYLDPQVDFYLKKSLFRDRSLYYRPFQGDTNLTEFYQQLYGLPGESVDWHVPEGFTEKLKLSPGFFTAPALIGAFDTQSLPAIGQRPIDLHARLGLGPDNGNWYRRMREDALARVRALNGVRVVSEGRVSRKAYMQELFNAKLCFSPFGYGELCWRDIEAILAGAVMVKPDMSHLETLPDLYEPGVTYLPVRWDFSDLCEVVRTALADPQRCTGVAGEARSRVKEYLRNNRFLADIGFLFEVKSANLNLTEDFSGSFVRDRTDKIKTMIVHTNQDKENL